MSEHGAQTSHWVDYSPGVHTMRSSWPLYTTTLREVVFSSISTEKVEINLGQKGGDKFLVPGIEPATKQVGASAI